MVAEKYVDMRTRFQTGLADVGNDASSKKPRLAVTTRTLEALIRLSTAHAKLKLRKDEVLPEDVEEAYKLMMKMDKGQMQAMVLAQLRGEAGSVPERAQLES